MEEAKTEYVPPPIQAEPAATYGINPPTHVPHAHPPRSLAARVVFALVLAALTAGLALSLVQGHSASLRVAHAEQQYAQLSRALGVNATQTSTNGGSVDQLGSKVSTLQQQMAGVSHYAICLKTWIDNTGNVTGVVLSTPTVNGNGVYGCASGVMVSVAPVPG